MSSLTVPLKRHLIRNDGGVWGEDPTGDGDTPVIRSTDIELDGQWAATEPAMRHLSPAERLGARLRDGDLIVVKSSGSAAHLGKTALVSADLARAGCCFSNFVQRLRTGPSLVPRFAWYFLNSNAAATQVDQLCTTTTGLKNITGNLIGELKVPVLSVARQMAITAHLDSEVTRVDVLSKRKERLVALLDERWQTLMHLAVAGHLTSTSERRPTSVAWLSDLPAHWQEGLVKLVARLGSGHTPSRSHPEWWVDATIPWVTTGEVAQLRDDRREYIVETRERISELGLANSSAVVHPAGTVVLCRTASAGYSGIMASNMATSQDFVTWTCGPRLLPRFLLLCLRAMRRDLLQRLAQGSTHKTIYMPDIESIKVPLPPLEEQADIVDAAYRRLVPIDSGLTALRAQLSLLREHRQAMIAAAVMDGVCLPEAA